MPNTKEMIRRPRLEHRLHVVAAGCGLISIAMATLLCSPAPADSIATASHIRLPTTTGGFNTIAGMAIDGPSVFDNRTAQTFLATQSGFLNTAAFVASRFPGTTVPLRVDVASVVAGQPAITLASALVPLERFEEGFLSGPADLNIFVNMSMSGALLEAGQTYALVFSTDSINANYRLYGASFLNVPGSDPYAGGTMLRSQNGSVYQASSGSDLYFEVTVTPIPEPSSVMLTAIAVMLGILRYLRHR